MCTLVPFDADNDVELLPFGSAIDALLDSDAARLVELLAEYAANVALFMPLGAVLAQRGLSLRPTAACGLVLSVGAEGAQLLVPGRTTSSDDVMLNTLGAAVGYLVLSSLRR